MCVVYLDYKVDSHSGVSVESQMTTVFAYFREICQTYVQMLAAVATAETRQLLFVTAIVRSYLCLWRSNSRSVRSCLTLGSLSNV